MKVLKKLLIGILPLGSITLSGERGFTQEDRERFFHLEVILSTRIFTTLAANVIGFADWDRRTIIKKAKEETVKYL